MLLRFGIENHKSICDYQEVNFAASTGLKDADVDLLQLPSQRGPSKLFIPVIALYGANAAGKSNMIDGFKFLFRSVRTSYVRWRGNNHLPQTSCNIDDADSERESLYDCDIVVDDVRYTYGFALRRDGVTREWLHGYPLGARRSYFEREFVDGVFLQSGQLVKTLDASLQKLLKDRRTLFLSAAGHLEFEPLLHVFRFFKERISVISASDEPRETNIAGDLTDSAVKSVVEEFLRKADFGISHLQIESEKIGAKQIDFRNKLFKILEEVVEESLTPTAADENRIVKFVHRRPTGGTFVVRYSDESSGTKHLLALLSPIIAALKTGAVVVLDEITTTLHTNLSRELVKLFSSKKTNPNNAQLLFSTHDTNLLACGALRRDEIWFAEKSPNGKTTIYPLTDFTVRKSENIEKGYLQGRYGAVPFFGDFSTILKFEG